ncbi:MAG TPA: aldehyde dehydrogenase family protein, partial [Acidimicrobiales bacterium]|nr:aldehyde dehydrogenase family protein [Acidimicrobiales bacterium]
ACFPSAGQLCVSMERLYVTEGVADSFIDEFVTRTGGLRLGATYDFSADVGSLTNRSQLDTVTEHVNDAHQKGATVLAGGRARPDVGPLFYEPTILTDVTPDMTVYAHETFGPVVSIYRVPGVEEAVRRANDSEYGLNASVWTRNTRLGREVAARLKSGTVNVNEAFAAAWGSIDAPMGGMGDSGLGRRHAAEGLLKYTEPQTIAVQHLQGFDPPDWLPHERFAAVMTTMLEAMKRFGVK